MGYGAENNYGEATMVAVESFDGFNRNNICDRNEYIRTAENYMRFPEGLKQFIDRKYGETPENELRAFIEERSRERGVDLPKQTIKNWLSGSSNPQCNPTSRDIVYKLCFALGFTVEETQEFFGKVYLDRPYDSRNIKEAVYLFCMNNNYSFKRAEEIITVLDAENNSSQHAGYEMTISKTKALSFEILKLKTESDFLAFVDANRNSFGIHNNVAMGNYEKLLEEAKKMAGVTSNAKLLDIIYDCGLEKIRKDSNATIKKNSKFLDVVKMNFPQKQQLSDIGRGKTTYDKIRKALILLKFYSFFMHVGEDNSEDDREQFYQETNDMLLECGYWTLYPRNPYDWIFMYCAACSHDKNCDVDINQPLEELKDIMFDIFAFE